MADIVGKNDEVTTKTDVWALGVILYRCLTGVLPFEGDSVLDTLERVKTVYLEQGPQRNLCAANLEHRYVGV